MEEIIVEDNYPKAYKEVMEILKYVPDENINKIPKSMIEMFNIKMDKSYNFKIDISKELEEQNILNETKSIIANIFRDYWATPYQRERIVAKEHYDREKEEEEKRKKYDPNDIFKEQKERRVAIEREYSSNDNLPIEVKKEKFYQKIINYIKNFLKLN